MMQSNPKPLGDPPNHKDNLLHRLMASFPASGVAAHHMQLVAIALQPMTPVTAVAKGVTGNKFAEHPLPIQ